MENKNLSPSVQYFKILWKNKILIFWVTLFVGIGSTLYSLYAIDVQYVSSVNLVPPKSSAGAFENILSNVGGALKDFGLKSLGGGSGADGFEYMVILQSRTVVDSIINKYNLIERYELTDSEQKMKDTRKTFFGNLLLEFQEEGNYVISVWDTDPDSAALIANDYAEIANGIAAKIDKDEAIHNLEYMEKRLASLDSAFYRTSDSLKVFANKYKVFSFEDQIADYSKAFSELKSKELTIEMYYDMGKELYGEDDFKTQTQKQLLDGIREKIYEVENESGFVGELNFASGAEIGVKYARLYAEFETFSKFRSILLPMIEKARLDVNKSVKNLFVLDKAIPAEKKDRPKRSLIVLGSMAGTFVLMVFFIMINDSLRKILEQIRD